ncbi:MAG: FtsX-like permease family protein [Acidobacteria bacterium]|nr:MAG: FtsX-like permease family protein [Acidobacteriota bacterium]
MRRYWNLFRRNRLVRDIAEELATHAAMLEEANRSTGANRRLGNDLALRERTRAADVHVWLDELLRDIGFARRSLWRARGFAAVAVLTLALGIGATTAMFSVVRTVVLDPLPYPGAARLVSVRMYESWQGKRRLIVNLPTQVLQALSRSRAFTSVGIVGYDDDAVVVDGTARDAYVSAASPRLLATLRVRPEVGHGFSASGQDALVSDRFWHTQLGSSRAVIGRTIRIGRRLYAIAGVLPPGKAYPPYTSVWIAGTPGPDATGQVIARLPDSVPLAQARSQAQAAIAVIAQRQARALHSWGADGLALVPPMEQLARPQARTALWMLFAAVVCLLLIACANTTNLLLGRGLARHQEFALRRALGAGRLRLASLLLAEGLWLALAGATAGAGLAWLLLRLARLGPENIPRLDAVQLDPATLGFAAAVGLAAGLICALAPALRFARTSVRDSHTQRLRQGLVIAEIALTLVLLTGGTLLVRSFSNLLNTDPGFTLSQTTIIGLTAPSTAAESKHLAWPRRSQTFQRLLARVRALPGVTAATYTVHLPFTPENSAFLRLPSTPGQSHAATGMIEIGPHYFAAMGIPLLAGRSFSPAEESQFPGKSMPVVVNAALAAQFWPGQPPASVLGRSLAQGDDSDVIIGVAGNTRDNDDLAAGSRSQVYFPYYGNFDEVEFLVRSPLPPAAIAQALEALLPRASANLVASQPITLNAALAAALAQPRFRALLLTLFALLAWLLALVGLYGVLAFQVRQRRREIGVRMALGADSRAVIRMVLGQNLAVLAAGIAAGWLLCWFLSRYISSLLFGVSAFDPLTWLLAGAALLAAGLLASFLPARRALRIDAAETLRCE